MPQIEGMENFQGTNFGFSGVSVDNLGADEYTLVGICVDRSGTTSGFQDDMEKCVQEIVKACALSDRADNLMIRYTTFDDKLDEVHGYKLLPQCNLDDYLGTLVPGGRTALYDSVIDMFDSIAKYGEELQKNDYDVNAAVFIITDGLNNASAYGLQEVKNSQKRIVSGEYVESMLSVLIGINVDPNNIQGSDIGRELQRLKDDAELSQFVAIQDTSKKTLAKLANFVSRSISSQSKSLGSKAPSQSLQF